MKTFLSILLLSIPTLFFGQDIAPKIQHEIGLSLSYDSLNGLTTELRYDKYSEAGYFFRAALFTNVSDVYGLKLGLHKAIVINDHLDIDFGINLRVSKYTDQAYRIEGESKKINLGYEIPLNLRYHITPTVDFNLGISIINDSQPHDAGRWNSGFNFGVSKGF